MDKELDTFIKELGGKFPRTKDWEKYERLDLYSAIVSHHGGMNAVRIRKGFALDEWGEKTSYYHKRGHKVEEIIVGTLKEYAKMCGFIYSKEKQAEVGPAHRVELVCGKDKKVAFDVTRSDTRRGVENHWIRKKYHKFVDTYVVIVVSKHFDEKTYNIWNQESPDNVCIIDYRKFERFLNGLSNANIPFEFPLKKKQKLDAIAECTFDNKEKIKEKFQKEKSQKSLDDFN